MFKVIFTVGGIIIGALYVVSKKARERLERHENPLQ